ncbi:MAG: hypothetical protein A2Y12_17060 [Planctomycetes bacterium GWF2_42_9]|nr:MAG: hypothetical protein A2Y12_17060 [Planctomycetes bacterium GWF2_42_9]
MNMSWFDWTLVICFTGFIAYAAISTQKLTRSVADFLAADRCAGRYLLGTAEGQAGFGIVSIIAVCEQFYVAGFSPSFWSAMSVPFGLLIAFSGWVIYRYRQTRAMTIAQFFEMRYSRKFRIYTGILAWVAGTINFGMFPGIGTRFFIKFCGFPQYFEFMGITWTTYPILMLILITVTLYFTLAGGQIAVLVTDFWQGFLSSIFLMALIIFLWIKFPWSTLSDGLIASSETGKSLINPLDIGQQQGFNFSFFAMMLFINLYSFMAWQGTQGFNCSAVSAHEAKMAKIVGSLRNGIIGLSLIIIPLSAIAIMHHPDYNKVATQVVQELRQTYPGNEQLQTQMTVTTAVGKILPSGLIGAFVVVMLGLFVSSHSTCMHSWGSIFVQDVICPIRKKPLSTERHMLILRLSVVFQAVFIFLFSWLYPMSDFIMMFLSITGAIFVGGAGSVIIGGLYWKRGTTAAAWVSMTVGCLLSLSAIAAQQIWPHIPEKVAYWYELEPGRDVQLEGMVVLSEKEGLTFEAKSLKLGKKALAPLPQVNQMTLKNGQTMYVGAKSSTISEIISKPDAAKAFVFRGQIVEKLKNSYYRVADENKEHTLIAKISPPFPINGLVMAFWCAALGVMSYVIVSLFTCKGKTVDMDKLLHRGQYTVKEDEDAIKENVKEEKPVGRFWAFIGVNSHEFSRVDKGLFLYMTLTSAWTFGGSLLLLCFALHGWMNDHRWLIWWRIQMYYVFVTAIVGCIWVSIGGIFDLKKMYHRLRTKKRNELDDGHISNNLLEEEVYGVKS